MPSEIFISQQSPFLLCYPIVVVHYSTLICHSLVRAIVTAGYGLDPMSSEPQLPACASDDTSSSDATNEQPKDGTSETQNTPPPLLLPIPHQHTPSPHLLDVTWLYPDQSSIMNPLVLYPSRKFLDSLSRKFVELFFARIPGFQIENYHERVSKFFTFVCSRTPITRGQLIHAYLLLQRLDQAERKILANTPPPSFQPLIVEATIGTLLLCSLAIGHQLNDDRPCTPTYWAKLLSITPQVVSASEIIFLKQIEYKTFVEMSEIVKVAGTLSEVYNSNQ